MPGIATQFRILDITVNRLLVSSDPDLKAVGQVMQNNSAYAHLGAIGPSLSDFIPGDPLLPGAEWSGNSFVEMWRLIYAVIGDDMLAPKGLLSLLESTRKVIGKLEQIANDEDLDALKDLEDSGDLGVLEEVGAGIQAIVPIILQIAPEILVGISNGLKPVVNVPTGNHVPDPKDWRVRDFLHWKKTGQFVENLIKRAEASGDDRFRAYAYGYVSSYAGKVCGSPFANSIVRGPYRTQWWRSRWIDNFVDAWVYGYYEASATMSGDTPSVPYEDWKNLCDANIQNEITIPGATIEPKTLMKLLWDRSAFPEILPAAFSDFWFEAYVDTYGNPPGDSPVKPAALNGAYVMTWMMLWFQTSGEVLGCNDSVVIGGPPSDCGEAPPWTDPSVPGDSGAGTPPTPDSEDFVDVDEAAIVCGWILAILGGLIFLGGGLLVGGAAIGGGVALINSGVDVNWAKLRCMIYWYKLYLANSLKGIDEVMVYAGLVHPYGTRFAQDETIVDLLGVTYDSAGRTVKSNALFERFPAAPWDGAALSWHLIPTSTEKPQTVAYTHSEYPYYFIDDDVKNPLSNGRVRDGGPWPTPTDPKGLPVQFGNAAANVVDLLAHRGDRLPDWNLDGDRGVAFLTWEFQNGTYTDPVAIEPEA